MTQEEFENWQFINNKASIFEKSTRINVEKKLIQKVEGLELLEFKEEENKITKDEEGLPFGAQMQVTFHVLCWTLHVSSFEGFHKFSKTQKQ